MARNDGSEAHETQVLHDLATMVRQADDNVEDPKDSDKTIHSGHFMVSRVHVEDVDDEEADDEASIPGTTEAPTDLDSKNQGYCFTEAAMNTKDEYKFGSKSVNHYGIDASLTKLFECMSLAYSGKITSPKWKNFRGIKLHLKDKIRLNNIIWREWHMQFIFGQNPIVCQFEPPISLKVHTKAEAVVLEGKYWKRRLESVTREYRKWRLSYKHATSNRVNDLLRVEEVLAHEHLLERVTLSSPSRRSQSRSHTPQLTNFMDMGDMDFLAEEFTSDNLFNSLNQPFAFPNPRELSQLGNADIIQPGLVQLQPNLDDIMDTLEPMPSFAGETFESQKKKSTLREMLQYSKSLNNIFAQSPTVPSQQYSSNLPIINENQAQAPTADIPNDIITQNLLSDIYEQANQLAEQQRQQQLAASTSSRNSLTSDLSSGKQNQGARSLPSLSSGQSEQGEEVSKFQEAPVTVKFDINTHDSMGNLLQPEILVPAPQAQSMTGASSNQLIFNTNTVEQQQLNNFGMLQSSTSNLQQNSQLQTNSAQPQSSPALQQNTVLQANGLLQANATMQPSAIQTVTTQNMAQILQSGSFQQSLVSNTALVNGSPSAPVQGATVLTGDAAAQIIGLVLPQGAQTLTGQGPPILPKPSANQISTFNLGGQSVTVLQPQQISQLQALLQGLDQNVAQTILAGNTTVASPSVLSSQFQTVTAAPLPTSNQQATLIKPKPYLHQQLRSLSHGSSSTGDLLPKSQPTPQTDDQRRASTGSLGASKAIVRNLANVGHAFKTPQMSQVLRSKHRPLAPAVSHSSNQGKPSVASQNTFLAQLLTSGNYTDVTMKVESDVISANKSNSPSVIPEPEPTPMKTEPTPPLLSSQESQVSPQPSLQSPGVSSASSIVGPADSSSPRGRNLSGDRVQYEEARKQSHVTAEKKRRINIKGGFDALHTLVPAISQNPNSKISKAAMLHKTASFLKKLKTERQQMLAETERLKRERDELNNDISICQSQLPATGVPMTRQRVDKLKELFDFYVQNRTLQNWKFFIFALIISPLFDSYNKQVSMTNFEELCRTVLAWLDQHCSLVALRPGVLNSLRLLSTTTSILSDPMLVPKEAKDAVLKKRTPHNSGNSSS